MTATYYIHGFGSSVNSSTYQLLAKKIEGIIPLTYDHNDPILSIYKMVIQICVNSDHPIIISSSLGGWFSEQVANRVPVDLILYNPSLNPKISLAKYGLDDSILNEYAEINSETVSKTTNRSVVLSMDDETVDPANALNIYSGNSYIITTNGGHRMTDQNLDTVVELHSYMSNKFGE